MTLILRAAAPVVAVLHHLLAAALPAGIRLSGRLLDHRTRPPLALSSYTHHFILTTTILLIDLASRAIVIHIGDETIIDEVTSGE